VQWRACVLRFSSLVCGRFFFSLRPSRMGGQHILPHDWLPEYSDPRVEGYPLVDNFWASAFTSLAYFIIVGVWVKVAKSYQKTNSVDVKNGNLDSKGSKRPVNKPPPSSFSGIKAVMFAYNFVMVIYSSFMVIEIVYLLFKAGYGFGCVPFDPTDNELQRRFIRVGYMFYISKYVELLDTFFFLWRGKLDQVSILHVFHHGAMPPSIYWGVKYAAGGMVFMFPLANSFVHVIMYTYYAMSVLGLHRFLWWKKYLTGLQMIQFCTFIIHQGQVFTINRECTYPKIFPLAIIIYAVIFLVLFGNFYVQAYWHRRRLATSTRQSDKSNMKDKEATILSNGHEQMKNGDNSNGIVVEANGSTTTHRKKAS